MQGSLRNVSKWHGEGAALVKHIMSIMSIMVILLLVYKYHCSYISLLVLALMTRLASLFTELSLQKNFMYGFLYNGNHTAVTRHSDGG